LEAQAEVCRLWQWISAFRGRSAGTPALRSTMAFWTAQRTASTAEPVDE